MNWTLSAISYFYFSFVGVCYMLGYWTPLHFNILDFLSPVDVIKSAAYPIIPALIGSVFWVVMDTVNSQATHKVEQDDPKLIKILFYILIFGLAILLLVNAYHVVLFLYLTVVSEPEKRIAFALPVISILSTVFFLNNPPFLLDNSRYIRNFTVIFMCALPTIAYYQGDSNISQTLAGDKGHYILSKPSKNCSLDESEQQIYLGFYSSTWFFVNNSTNDLCLEREGSVNLKYEPIESEEHDPVVTEP